MTVLESCSAERQHSGRRGRYFCLVIHEADEPDPDARSADGSARARLPPRARKAFLRIWLRHTCWPPPSQQVESELRRFGNPPPIQANCNVL